MNNNVSKILVIILVINLAISCTLVIALVTSTDKLQQEQKRIADMVEEIEPCENDSDDGLAVMGSIFMSELEVKVDEITEDIKEDIKTEIAGVEDSFSKYDEDIKSISSSLEELNVKMENVNNVIISVQEILDSIQNFFKIG